MLSLIRVKTAVYVTLGGMMGLGRLKVEGSKLLFQSSPNFSLRNLCIFFHLPVLLFGGEGGGLEITHASSPPL